ncbi:C40 family peptidase [Agrilactobacillus fermenti]|uniref:C40 family peptidase n=1 Tax=Agrilactobacillus fermenti TaxID=2586909 RepID=UPI003A5C35CB
MTHRKAFLTVSAGVAGLAGIALMNANQGQQKVQAATQSATVSYREGSTTVWASPNFQQPKSYVTYKQTVQIYDSKQIGNTTWYKVGDNAWIPGIYLSFDNKQAQPAATASTNTNPQSTTTNTTAASTNQTQAATAGQLTVTYKDGGTTLWSQAGFSHATGKYLSSGQTISYDQTQDVGGETWYHVANGWVPARYVSASGGESDQNAKHTAEVGTPLSAPSDAVSGTNTAVTNTATNTTATNSTATNTDQTKAQKVIALAEQQIGKPYVWGGKGPSSFDCSGLMQYVFANALGMQIGSWTVPQESAGTQIAVSQAQPGDLLFWGDRGSTYHVALYIGNNQYVNAPVPGENVTIASISQYFMPSFAVRVL